MLNALKKYKARKYFFASGIIIFGSSSFYVSSQIHFENAFDPVLQTFIMYLGEFLCIGFIFIRKSTNSSKNSPAINEMNASMPSSNNISIPYYQKYGLSIYIIPAVCEFLNSILEVICFDYFTSSTIVSLQMLKIIFVMYYRFTHVRGTVWKHRKLGLFIYTCGMIMTITEIIIYDNNRATETERLIGIALMFIAEFFGAATLLTMEKFMAELDTEPAKVNYLKGIFGLIICIILYFPIGLLLKLIYTKSDFKEPFESLVASYELPCFTITLIILFCFFNFFVVITLKFAEALTVCTIDSSRIVIIWIITISIDINSVDPIEMTGGLLIVLGLLIYNETLIIPWFGLKESAEESIESNRFYIGEKNKDKKTDIFFLDSANVTLILNDINSGKKS